MMERLNARKSLLVAARVYNIVRDSNGDIKKLVDAQTETLKDRDVKSWRQTRATEPTEDNRVLQRHKPIDSVPDPPVADYHRI